MTHVLAIAIGAAVGANPRYLVSIWAPQWLGTAFPYGTMIINMAGSFSIGLILALAETRISLSPAWRLLLVAGLLGGLTTFSTFRYETYDLLVKGSWQVASFNALGSVALGLLAVILGATLARLIP